MKTTTRTRSIALLTGGALVASALVTPQAAHADDKSKTYKTGAAILGALGAVLAVKGKTLPGVIAGAGAYYAYKKGEKAKDEERYGEYPYGDYRDNGGYWDNGNADYRDNDYGNRDRRDRDRRDRDYSVGSYRYPQTGGNDGYFGNGTYPSYPTSGGTYYGNGNYGNGNEDCSNTYPGYDRSDYRGHISLK